MDEGPAHEDSNNIDEHDDEMDESQLNNTTDSTANETLNDSKNESSQRPRRSGVRISAAMLLGRAGSKIKNKQKEKEKSNVVKSKTISKSESKSDTPQKNPSRLSLLSVDSGDVGEKKLSRGGSPAVSKWSDSWLIPFELGWRREIVYRNTQSQTKSSKQCDIYYYAPDNVKLRSIPMIVDYINRTKSDLTSDCFSFSKLQVYKEPFEIVRNAGQCTRSSTNTSASSSATSIQLNSNDNKNNTVNNKKNNRKSLAPSNNKEDADESKYESKEVIDEQDDNKNTTKNNSSTNSKKSKRESMKMQVAKQLSNIKNLKSDVDIILKSSTDEKSPLDTGDKISDIKTEVEEVENDVTKNNDANDRKSRASRKRKVSESYIVTSPASVKEKSAVKKRKIDSEEISKPKETLDHKANKDNDGITKRNSVGRPRKKPKIELGADSNADINNNEKKATKVKRESESRKNDDDTKCKNEDDDDGDDVGAMQEHDSSLISASKNNNGSETQNVNEPLLANESTNEIPPTTLNEPAPDDNDPTTTITNNNTTSTDDKDNTKQLKKEDNTNYVSPTNDKTNINNTSTSPAKNNNQSAIPVNNNSSTLTTSSNKPPVDSKRTAVRNAANLALRAYMNIAQRGGNHTDNNDDDDDDEVSGKKKDENVDSDRCQRQKYDMDVDEKPKLGDVSKIESTKSNVDTISKDDKNKDKKQVVAIKASPSSSTSPAKIQAQPNNISAAKDITNNNSVKSTPDHALQSTTISTTNAPSNNAANVKPLKTVLPKKLDQNDRIRVPFDSNGLKNLVCGPSCGRPVPPSVRCDVCMNLFHPECLGLSFINVKYSMVCWGCQSYARENENVEYPMVKSEEEQENKTTTETNGEERPQNNSLDIFEDPEEMCDDSDKVETQVLVINPAITKSLNIKKEFLLKVQDKIINVPPENIYITKAGVNVKLFENPLPPEYISGLNNPLKFLVGSMGGVQVLNVSLLNGPA